MQRKNLGKIILHHLPLFQIKIHMKINRWNKPPWTMHFLSVLGRTTLSQNVTGFWQDPAFNVQKLRGLKMQDETENDSFLARADSEFILDSQNFKWISVLLLAWISGRSHAMCDELEAVFKIDVISFFLYPKHAGLP